MSEVQRYRLISVGYTSHRHALVASKDGNFVSIEDYQALEAKVKLAEWAFDEGYCSVSSYSRPVTWGWKATEEMFHAIGEFAGPGRL